MTTLAELAKTVLGYWGFYLFLIAVVFMWMFRSQIAGFIERAKRFRAGKWGADATEQPEQKVTATAVDALTQSGGGQKTETQLTTPDARTAADELIAGLSVTPYIRSRESDVKTALATRGLDAGSPETYRVLTAFFASAIVTAECEQLYSILWTTQLQALNEANTRELTQDELRYFYDVGVMVAAERYGKYPFEDWLLFLTTQHLLVLTPAQKHAITVKGRTLLMYLIHEGRTLLGRSY